MGRARIPARDRRVHADANAMERTFPCNRPVREACPATTAQHPFEFRPGFEGPAGKTFRSRPPPRRVGRRPPAAVATGPVARSARRRHGRRQLITQSRRARAALGLHRVAAGARAPAARLQGRRQIAWRRRLGLLARSLRHRRAAAAAAGTGRAGGLGAVAALAAADRDIDRRRPALIGRRSRVTGPSRPARRNGPVTEHRDYLQAIERKSMRMIP